MNLFPHLETLKFDMVSKLISSCLSRNGNFVEDTSDSLEPLSITLSKLP